MCLEAKVYKIGVLYWSMNIPGQVAMRNGLELEAKKINQEAQEKNLSKIALVPMVAGDGETGIENQIKQMYQLIDQKVDLIIVQPTDNAALKNPLIKANQQNIPVIAYDQYISGGKLTAYRTSDNYQAGYLNGEYVSSIFLGKGEVKLILVEYPHVSSTVERLNGFLDALTYYKCKYKILKTYNAVEPISGKQAGLNILKDFPQKGSVDLIFCVNDGGCLPIVDELSKKGRKEIRIATVDGDPVSVKNVKESKLTVIDCAQFCGPLGAETIKSAYEYLTKGKTVYHALVPVFPITKETLKLYPGWEGPIPNSFNKPWITINKKWKGEIKIVK